MRSRGRTRRLQLEQLEPRQLLAADVFSCFGTPQPVATPAAAYEPPAPNLQPLGLAPAHAAGEGAPTELVNGDFSDGLQGWTVTDPDFVKAVDGRAVISEHTDVLVDHVGLYQDFAIPNGAERLRFAVIAVTTEPQTDFLPAAFEAALLDPATGTSLVPTVDPATDAFYIRDLIDGVNSGEAAEGVSELPLPGALPLHIHVDVAGLEGQEARLVFRLLGGGPGFATSVTMDQVAVLSQSELPAPWQNPINGLDVDANGRITPLDALLVINHLNREGSGPVPSPPRMPPPFLDVNGDNLVTPLDALLVINYLNSPGAFAEGEEQSVVFRDMSLQAEFQRDAAGKRFGTFAFGVSREATIFLLRSREWPGGSVDGVEPCRVVLRWVLSFDGSQQEMAPRQRIVLSSICPEVENFTHVRGGRNDACFL